jgi:hypothetical protein
MAFPDLPPKRKKPPLTPKFKDQRETGQVSMQHQRLIGRVVVIWSKIESGLDNTIWELAGVDMEIGRYLTRPFGAEGKIKVARSIAKIVLNDDQYKNFDAILTSITDCQEDRNFIMHAAWGTQHTGPFNRAPVGLSTRPKSDPDKVVGETFSAERMHQIAGDGITCLRTLIAFLDVLETSPEKLRRQRDQG